MSLPLAPGVYFQRGDSPGWVIDEARSDIAGFVGIAERGPLHQPVCIHSWTQFLTRFGRAELDYAYLPDAVHGFFANGGRTAWIVRVGRPVHPFLHASLLLVNDQNKPVFRVWARDPGVGGSTISVRVIPAVRNRFHLAIDVPGETGRRESLELWRDLECAKNDRYAPMVVNGWPGVNPPTDIKPGESVLTGSTFVVLEDLRSDEELQETPPREKRIAGVRIPRSAEERSRRPSAEIELRSEGFLGWDSDFVSETARSVLDGLTLEHFIGSDGNPWGLEALEPVTDVAVLAMPDLMWQKPPTRKYVPPRPRCGPRAEPTITSPAPEQRAEFSLQERQRGQLDLLAHCARLRNRFAILDPPAELDAIRIQQWVANLHSENGQFGAIYFPWIGVATADPGVRWLPPSGHLAGLFARVDLSSGVQKSPANEEISEAQGVLNDVPSEARGQLNVDGVNVLLASGTRGVRVMGARTLATPSQPELEQWRFVAVRRLLLMLEKSLENSGFWLVQADNRPQRWRDVERVIRDFLRRQWQRGRLGGATPEEAFQVECNESTNPWEEVEVGRMTCVLGVLPPPPAEFVFVRLGDRGGGGGTWSFGEGHHGTT